MQGIQNLYICKHLIIHEIHRSYPSVMFLYYVCHQYNTGTPLIFAEVHCITNFPMGLREGPQTPRLYHLCLLTSEILDIDSSNDIQMRSPPSTEVHKGN
jgi:hypothetical protein